MSARLSGFDRGLSLWILAAMGLGVALGASVPGWSELLGRATVRGVNVPIAIGLMAMLLPPLAHVRYRALPGMFRSPRILAISLVLNWIIGPALMFCLAAWWLPDRPDLFAGVVLIGIARCIAMVLVWNDLAGGDREFAAGLVALNSVFQIVAFPSLAWFYLTVLPRELGLSATTLVVPYRLVAESVAIYLGIPFVLAGILRWAYMRRHGEAGFDANIVPRLKWVTPATLLFTIVAMFSLKGGEVVALPGEVLRVAVPLLLYFGSMWAIAFAISRALRVEDPVAKAVAFTAAGNNFELAIAVAVAVFGLASGQAFAGVIGPLIEVPALIGLVAVARKFAP
jgi:ACR3 family arsenite transporter